MRRGLIGAFVSAMGGAAALGRAVATDRPISWLALLGIVLLTLAAVRWRLRMMPPRATRVGRGN